MKDLITVEAPGLFTTVQDLGRQGYGPLGVSPSGAADPTALRLGNLLVGNQEGAAALEMTLLGGSFRFHKPCIIALTGSDFGATLSDASDAPFAATSEATMHPTQGASRSAPPAAVPVPLWTSVSVQAGQLLRLGPTQTGARCYLAVRGGIAVTDFLGSSSTHILSGLGGFAGRALRRGDMLDAGDIASPVSPGRRIQAEFLQRLAPRKILRVTAGPQMDWFSDAARHAFLTTSYTVSEESNRMGIRLLAAADAAGSATTGREMITEGVCLGAVQVPASGAPIILFVEQQTTGGYPKIANVISADLPSLGQLRPRDEIRFELVEWELARAQLAERESLLRSSKLIAEP